MQERSLSIKGKIRSTFAWLLPNHENTNEAEKGGRDVKRREKENPKPVWFIVVQL
jgi:hypothetical protein